MSDTVKKMEYISFRFEFNQQITLPLRVYPQRDIHICISIRMGAWISDKVNRTAYNVCVPSSQWPLSRLDSGIPMRTRRCSEKKGGRTP